jgi:hypothetical protein
VRVVGWCERAHPQSNPLPLPPLFQPSAPLPRSRRRTAQRPLAAAQPPPPATAAPPPAHPPLQPSPPPQLRKQCHCCRRAWPARRRGWKSAAVPCCGCWAEQLPAAGSRQAAAGSNGPRPPPAVGGSAELAKCVALQSAAAAMPLSCPLSTLP